MAIAKRAPNLAETISIVRDLGGSIIEVMSSKKHVQVRVATPKGNTLILTLSKGKTEPHLLKGWTRQQFNRADAKAHERNN